MRNYKRLIYKSRFLTPRIQNAFPRIMCNIGSVIYVILPLHLWSYNYICGLTTIFVILQLYM